MDCSDSPGPRGISGYAAFGDVSAVMFELPLASIDLFCDESEAYARRVQEAGVEVMLDVVPWAFHGFDVVGADTRIARDFLQRHFDYTWQKILPSGSRS